jgi:transcription elongation factor Elf1
LDVLIHYIEEHIQNGVTFSFISEFQAALVVLEQAGRIPEGKQLSRDPLWKAHVESWKQELATNTFPKAAKPYTTAILLALELFVIEMDHEFCLRLIAWCMLVSTWAAMRVDDLQNVMPESVRLSNRGLTLRMARTKTTGGAKLHGPICAFVARDISISGYDWLIEGFQMLQREDLMFPRDYFIPTPGKDWTLFKNKILEPPSMANYFRIVLGKLGTPRFQDGFWRQNKAMDLVPGAMLLFWSGHSPRHFLTQAAASLGVDKTKRDFLGRWSIGRTGSNAYLHTSRQVVEEVQHLVRDSIVLGAPALDESELLEDIMHFADKHELVGQRVRRRHTHDYKRANAGEVFNTFDSDVEQVDVQEKQQVMEAVQREAGENPTHLGYFITTSRRTGFRRLHMHGKCPVRSDRCIDSTDVDNVQDAAYDAICKICQRKISEELGRMTADHDVSSDSGDSSSTNTSGDEAEAEEAEAGEASEWQPLI